MNKTLQGFIRRSDEYKLLSKVIGRKQAFTELARVVSAPNAWVGGYHGEDILCVGLNIYFSYDGNRKGLNSFVVWSNTPQGDCYWRDINKEFHLNK